MGTRLLSSAALVLLALGCAKRPSRTDPSSTMSSPGASAMPQSIIIAGVAQNPEGIEYNHQTQTFLLSSLNAGPILAVGLDGTHTPFANGEAFPMSTAGLQLDPARTRLLAAAFNGTELFDEDPQTRGLSHLRIYDLKTGALERDIDLSSLLPDAPMYFANDVAVDDDGNAYVSDWFAGVVYRVDLDGTASVLWTNEFVVPGGPNGLDVHPDGYLLVSLLNDGTYSEHALVKVPLDDPGSASEVAVSGTEFSGFDGMVLTSEGTVIGVTNDGVAPGGNLLLELSSADDWATARIDHSTAITTSTTVAVTPESKNYVINQDFTDAMATTWIIERIDLRQ